jgi:hypothetical protein
VSVATLLRGTAGDRQPVNEDEPQLTSA